MNSKKLPEYMNSGTFVLYYNVIKTTHTMAKFKYGQFIIKQAHPIDGGIRILGTDLVWWQRSDKVKYGIFEVTPYNHNGWEAPISYKVSLVPAGSSVEQFLDDDYYTSDLSDIKEDMIFDSLESAEKSLKDIVKE